MSSSYSTTETNTFTVTHARHIAAKVATDLKRLQRLYGAPSDASIADYEIEVIELMKAGFLDTITYGFRRDGNWIEPTLVYTAKSLAGESTTDDDPGRIRPGANISGASFYSYLIYNGSWDKLNEAGKNSFRENLPFKRGGANEPGIAGYLSGDKTYSAGGKSLGRASVRSY